MGNNLLRNTSEIAKLFCEKYICDDDLCDGLCGDLCGDDLCDDDLCGDLCEESLCDESICDGDLCEENLCDESNCDDDLCGGRKKRKTIAIDATCGNGHDTLWLADRCSEVYAFDIQKSAVKATEKLLSEKGLSNVTCINDSHANMKKYLPDGKQPKVIMFNLGYLPGGDKSITTDEVTTIEALKESLEILAVDGVICVTVYWGHPQGEAERRGILKWAESLDKGKYHCVYVSMVNQPNRPPEILLITKKH